MRRENTMTILNQLKSRLAALFGKHDLDADMTEEMRAHIEMRTQKNIEAGMSPEEARFAALRQFGWTESIKDNCRDQRGLRWLENLAQDVRFGARQLRKNPGFTAVAVLTLALGIGINTSMFSALQALLTLPAPYPDPARLVQVFRTSPRSQRWPHSPASFCDQQAQNHDFESMAALNPVAFNLAEPGQLAERVNGMRASAELFPLLGIQPELGRVFSREEDRPGRDNVIVLNHGFWLRKFAGDTNIIGRTLRLDGEPVTVVGVMPERFYDRRLWGGINFWRPIAFTDGQRQDRNGNYLKAVARLKPGVTVAQAQAGMNVLVAQLLREHPENNPAEGLTLVPLEESGMDPSGRRGVWLTMGLAGFVLLIACANLANLQFARTALRGRELAIRGALGAARGRLLQNLITESLLIALLGGALGLVLAYWGNALLSKQIMARTGTVLQLALGLGPFGFACAASTLSGLVFGLVPAWMASRTDLNHALKQDSRGTTSNRSQHRIQHALVIAEVALALALLTGAGLVVRGLQRFASLDPGWRLDGLTVGYLSLPESKYGSDDARRGFIMRLQERLSAIPGVEHAALARSLPVSQFSVAGSFGIEGRPGWPKGQQPLVFATAVTPGLFETLKMRLMSGRDFTTADTTNHPAVVVINEAMARALWPGESPLGKRIGEEGDWQQVVGVVSNVRFPADPSEPITRFQTYLPFAQDPKSPLAVALRGDVSAEVLRRAVVELDPDQAVNGISSARAALGRTLGNFALVGHLLTGFAVVGLILAGLGIYGVITGFVVSRTNEIGVRMALGAQVGKVLWLVLGKGLRLALLGMAIGLIAALVIARLLASISPELETKDPITMVGVVALLLGVVILACWLPARRAARLDPINALRAE
jgi:putative ABC transport system permease protein